MIEIIVVFIFILASVYVFMYIKKQKELDKERREAEELERWHRIQERKKREYDRDLINFYFIPYGVKWDKVFAQYDMKGHDIPHSEKALAIISIVYERMRR